MRTGKTGASGVLAAGASMAADEYRQAIEKLEFSQQSFAKAVGASPRTGQKWALGETRIPGSVAMLLRLLLARPELVSVMLANAPPPTRTRAPTKRKKRST